MILSQCKPELVFRFFEEISQIPRGSGNEKAVSDYIAAYARGKGYTVTQDAWYNLLIRKPGTPGYENHTPLVLQGHLDMVCEKNKNTAHDFTQDPIRLKVDGDFIRADGTTLGADNGIAIAIFMALLEADGIAHPPLEILMTADEEAGMTGAEKFDIGLLKGRRMINMDTAQDNTLFAGCVGGTRATLTMPASWEDIKDGEIWYKVEVTGLKGGHSGEDIEKERGNSLRLLARALTKISRFTDIKIAAASGGMKVNALPREAEALITVKKEALPQIDAAVEDFYTEAAAEYRVSAPDLMITGTRAHDSGQPGKVLSQNITQNLIKTLLLLPHGILHMSRDIPGLPETSCNMGVLEINEKEIVIQCMPRSLSTSRQEYVRDQIDQLCRLTGFNAVFSHAYPAWVYNPDSPLREKALAVYRTLRGEEAQVTVVHAGLECGVIFGKMPDMDIISFGPDTWDLHNPYEHLSISSTARVWEFLLALLKEL